MEAKQAAMLELARNAGCEAYPLDLCEAIRVEWLDSRNSHCSAYVFTMRQLRELLADLARG